MKKIALFFLLTPLIGVTQQYAKNFIDQNYIEVNGTVESEIIPDEIHISITINEQDKKGKISVEQQEIKLIQQLKAIGINTEKNLSVASFDSRYVDYFLKKDNVLKKKQYTLIVNNTQNLAQAFKVFDALEISNVYINKVDHSKLEALKLEAKVKAIKIAKQKAQAYANAIEQNVGKALFLTENNIVNPMINNNGIYGSSSSNIIIRGSSSLGYKNKAMENKIAFKKIIITASVEAKFELL